MLFILTTQELRFIYKNARKKQQIKSKAGFISRDAGLTKALSKFYFVLLSCFNKRRVIKLIL